MTQKNSKTGGVKQRSFNLSDHAFGLITAAADRNGLSYSAFLEMHARQTLGGQAAREPFTAVDRDAAIAKHPASEIETRPPAVPRRGKTILPPDSTSSFKVAGDRVDHRRSRRDTQLREGPDR